MSEALEERVQGLVSQGDIPGAIQELDAALSKTPQDISALRLRASLHALGEDWLRVAADLRAVVAREPMARLNGALANALKRAGDLPAARAEYDRELLANPADAFLRLRRAELRREGGDARGARADFAEAARLKKDDADILCALADAEAGLGKNDEAGGHLDAAVACGDWRHRLNRGAFRAKLARWAEAETDLDAVIFEIADAPALSGALAEALRTRAWAKFCQGKRDALDDAEEALRLAPDDAQALCIRGGIRTMRKDPRAEKDLDRALELDPRLALAHAFRGDLLLAGGDKAAALREFREATRLEPELGSTFADSIRRAGG